VRRHLSNLALVFSLVAGALVLLLWVRSHWIGDQVEWVQQRRGDTWAAWHQTFVRSEAGGLRVNHRQGREAGLLLFFEGRRIKPTLAWTVEAAVIYPYTLLDAAPPDFRMYGLAWGSETNDNAGSRDDGAWRYSLSEHFLVVPYWLLFLVASVLPAYRLVQTRRSRRRGGRGFDVSAA
jgi:hypothetical protein